MENTPVPPPNPTQPPVVPPPPPAQGPAQGQVVAGYVPVAPGQIPGQGKGGTPWFVWVLASCGGCAVLLIVLIIIVVVALNPLKRIGDAEDSLFKTQVNKAGLAVTACIEGEKTKGVVPDKIYSLETCANEDYLIAHYSSEQVLISSSSSTNAYSKKFLVNESKNKICIYATYTKPDSKVAVVSWDSTTQTVNAAGTKTCV